MKNPCKLQKWDLFLMHSGITGTEPHHTIAQDESEPQTPVLSTCPPVGDAVLGGCRTVERLTLMEVCFSKNIKRGTGSQMYPGSR